MVLNRKSKAYRRSCWVWMLLGLALTGCGVASVVGYVSPGYFVAVIGMAIVYEAFGELFGRGR